jgi:hypothetical protein
MRVFLDHERQTPEGWVRVWWPAEAIALLEGGEVTQLSLDHDLGDDARGTGYDVVLWVEEAVALRGFKPPRMRVHSANSSARAKMEAGIAAIERLATSRVQGAVELDAGVGEADAGAGPTSIPS